MTWEEDLEEIALFRIALQEARLTLMKYEEGILSEYTAKEHVRMDLEKLVRWSEDY